MREHIIITKALGMNEHTEIHMIPTWDLELDHSKLEEQAKKLARAFSAYLPSFTFDLLIKEMLKYGSTKTVKEVCPECDGAGETDYKTKQYYDGDIKIETLTCERCKGRGVIWIDDEREEVEE